MHIHPVYVLRYNFMLFWTAAKTHLSHKKDLQVLLFTIVSRLPPRNYKIFHKNFNVDPDFEAL